MNGLVKWFIKYELKRHITNASVKDAVHDLNSQFAQKVRLEGKEKVADVVSDVMRCTSARLDGFADDGQITGGELATINSIDDAVVDKYLSDAQISVLIERMFANNQKVNQGVIMNKNVQKKSGILKNKIKKIVGKLVKPAKKLAVCVALAALAVGCATVDQQSPQPSDQKALQAGKSETQNVEMHNSNVYIFVGVTKIPRPGSTNLTDKIYFGEIESEVGHTISVLSQAQALETTGSTETYSPANTPANTPTSNPIATPTNDVKPDVKLTYGLASDTTSGRSWIADLTDASIRGLSSLLSSKKSEQMTVTHSNGQTETVTCANGICTTASGDKITYSGGACSPGSECSYSR